MENKERKSRWRRFSKMFLLFSLLFSVASLTLVSSNAAYLPSSYRSDADYYYWDYGTFHWYGNQWATEYNGSWYSDPMCPETLYSTNINDNQFNGYYENNGLGFTCYSVWWNAGNSARPSYARNVGRYIKQATANYRRAKTTPTQGRIEVEGATYINGNDYWIKPYTTVTLVVTGHQEFLGGVQQLDDWVNANYINLQGSGSNLATQMSYNGENVVIFDTDLIRYSFGSRWYENNDKDYVTGFYAQPLYDNMDLNIKTYHSSQNGKATNEYINSGKRIRTDGVAPTLGWAGVSNAYQRGNIYWVKPGNNVTIKLLSQDSRSGVAGSYLRLGDSTVDYRLYHDINHPTWDNMMPFYSINGIYSWDNNNPDILYVSGGREINDGVNAQVAYTIQPKTDNHIYDIQYYFGDNVGNVTNGYLDTGSFLGVDGTAPSVSFSPNGNYTARASQSTEIRASDIGSGLNSIQYAWSTSNTSTPTSWTNVSSGQTVTAPSSGGTYYLWVKATDNLGNSTTVKSNGFIVKNNDSIAPTVSANPSSGNWKNTSHSVSLTYTDDDSGVKTKQYAWTTSTATPSSWINYSGTVTQPEAGIYYLHYYTVDNAGNSRTGYFGPYQYENTPPTGTISQTPTGWTSGNVTISLTNVTDTGGSGLKNIKLPNSSTVTGANASQAVSKNGSYRFVITDNAGNTTTKVQTVTNIDKTNPTVRFGTNGNSNYAKSYSTTINVSDSQSGVKASQYAWSPSNSVAPTNWTYFSNGATLTTPSFSGTHYLWVKATDNAGNTITTKSNGFNVDVTAPTASTSQSTTNWTNGSVTLNLSNIADSGGSGYKNTRLPGGMTYITTTTATYTASVNGIYEFIITDNAGNTTTKSFKVSNIDKNTPSISFSPNGNTTYGSSQSTKVTVSDDGGSGIKTSEYAWSTSNTVPPSSLTSFTSGSTLALPTSTGTYYLWVKGTDNAGNVATSVSNAFKVDTTVPTFSANPSSGEWKTTPYVVTPTFGDSHSGVKTQQYAWTTSTDTPSKWTNYSSGTLTQPGTGTYYLHYHVVDKAGNSKTGYVGPYRFENTPPTGTLVASTTTWTNKNVILNLTGVADSGGSGYYRTKLPDGSYVTTTSATFTATANGTYSFVIYDNAGNSTTKSLTVSNIDKSNPNADLTASPTNWTNGEVTLKLANVTDSGVSGFDHIQLPNGSTVTTTSVEYKVSNNGTYHFVIYDKAGNTVTKTITITNIDKVKPQGTLSYSTTNPTNGNVVVTLNASDNASGVKSITLPNGTIINGSSTSLSVSANGTYAFMITDVAGNSTTITAVVENIDKAPPTFKLIASTEDWTNDAIVITAIASDEGGIAKIVLPNGSTVTESKTNFTVNGNGTYTFTAFDKVGNQTKKSITIGNFDGDKPSVKMTSTSQSGTRVDVRMEYGD